MVDDGVTRLQEPYVHRIFSSNIYHLRGRDADLVIDFGMGLAPLKVALGVSSVQEPIALATHSHADHVGTFHEFPVRLGHAAEAGIFSSMDDAHTGADLFRRLPEPVIRQPSDGWSVGDYRIHPAPLTGLVGEGDIVDLGDRGLQVLHLPGHSPGSIGLLDEARGLFFSGDAIYDGALVDDLPSSDKVAYRQTMERLLRLDVRLVLGGHGNAMTGDAMRKAARDYLDGNAAIASLA